jgi:hypothetical protein
MPRGSMRDVVKSRAGRWTLIALAALGALVALVLVAGPPIIHRVIEGSLEDMPGGYRGSMAGVDLRPLSLEVALLGLKIEKKSGDIPVPYMEVEEFIIDTVRDSWKPRTAVRIVGPVVNLVDAPSEESQQWGPKFELAKLRKQLPFELIQVDIERAQVHFRNYHAKPEIDAYLHDASVHWEGLVGCLPPGSSACRSSVTGRSKLMKSGDVTLEGHLHRKPEVDVEGVLQIRELSGRELNPVLSEYAKVDLEQGRVAATARYRGRGDDHFIRLVPRFNDVKVVGSERKDARVMREVGLALATGWFERKDGEKAIDIRSKNGGKFDFNLVDLPSESADRKRD